MISKKIYSLLLILLAIFFLSGCVGVAPGISPVSNFESERYLGKWYEIARLDHWFERGLEKVTAEYTPKEDGGIRVINKGYSMSDQQWDAAEGKAYFVSADDIGHLKVSFFGPFYGSYVIFELDKENYEYAFITSYKKSYLWLLARKPEVSQSVIDKFMALAEKNGYKTDELIFVKH